MNPKNNQPKGRVIVFIDGFNLYHAIEDLTPPNKLPPADWRTFCQWKQQLKWLDLMGLASTFIGNHHEELKEVLYFSAYATWMPDQHKRHQAYVDALKTRNVSIVLGRFKPRDKRCKATCKEKYIVHEEKETDVNVALYLTNYGWQDKYDHAILVSGDSDLVPAVASAVKLFPAKKVTIATPPNRGAKELVKAANNQHLRIRISDLLKNLFPENLTDDNGTEIIRPTKYNPPPGVDWSNLY